MNIQKIEHYKSGRMKFNKEFHSCHLKPWTDDDEKYLIEQYHTATVKQLSYALGRTESSILERARVLRKQDRLSKKRRYVKEYEV